MTITKILFLFAMILSFSLSAQVNVKGYYRKNGTYVAPHVRSSPNNTKSDNYGRSGSGQSSDTPAYLRDQDGDGISNQNDLDDDNDGVSDDNE